MLGSSGTVTTLAGVNLALPRYIRALVDGSMLTFDQIEIVSRHLAGLDIEGRAANPCVGRERADLVLSGCAILDAICSTWPVGRLRVADRGIREGILFDLMHGRGRLAKWARAKPSPHAERVARARGRVRVGSLALPNPSPRGRGQARQAATRFGHPSPCRARQARAPPESVLDRMAGAAAQRSLCRRGAAARLPLARRLQADPARRALSSAGARPPRRRSRLCAGRLDAGRGRARRAGAAPWSAST